MPYITQVLIRVVRRLYRVFGSGASHGPYAQLTHQSALANKGKPISHLRGAITRMVTFFYAMHHCLCLRQPLLATVHSPQWATLSLKAREKRAILDIENTKIWKAINVLLRSVFPALRALRVADTN